MNKVKVIGIGSPYADDTVGWRAIEKLKQQHSLGTLLPARVDLIEADRPGINLIQMFQGADFVILIDAILDKSNRNIVIRVSNNQLISTQHAVSSHSMGVANAIALADKLNILPEKLLIIGLGIDRGGEESVTDRSIDVLADAVTRELLDYLQGATSV